MSALALYVRDVPYTPKRGAGIRNVAAAATFYRGNFPSNVVFVDVPCTQDKLGRTLAFAVGTFLAFQSKIRISYGVDMDGRGRVGLSDHFKMWPFSSVVRLEFGRPTDQAGQSTPAPTNLQPEHSIGKMGLDEGCELLTFLQKKIHVDLEFTRYEIEIESQEERN